MGNLLLEINRHTNFNYFRSPKKGMAEFSSFSVGFFKIYLDCLIILSEQKHVGDKILETALFVLAYWLCSWTDLKQIFLGEITYQIWSITVKSNSTHMHTSIERRLITWGLPSNTLICNYHWRTSKFITERPTKVAQPVTLLIFTWALPLSKLGRYIG
jgi:hypothetical protein